MHSVDSHFYLVMASRIERYTLREVERFVRVRKLYHDLSAKNVRNVNVWLRSNQRKNVPISVEDINISEGIYKTEVKTLNGESVRPHPP